MSPRVIEGLDKLLSDTESGLRIASKTGLSPKIVLFCFLKRVSIRHEEHPAGSLAWDYGENRGRRKSSRWSWIILVLNDVCERTTQIVLFCLFVLK